MSQGWYGMVVEVGVQEVTDPHSVPDNIFGGGRIKGSRGYRGYHTR